MSDAVQRESTPRRGFYDDVDGDESKLPVESTTRRGFYDDVDGDESKPPVDPAWLDTFERAYDAGMWP